MSCCGDKEEGDPPITNPLLPSSTDHNNLPSSSSSSSSSAAVLSPMNSNFTALLSPDTLRSIMELLPPLDLSRAACVSRLWRSIASDRDVQEKAFRSPWRVSRVLGEPSSPNFWRQTGLDRFAVSHRIQRGDTVPGLALKYSVQVMDIKRLNNMMSDHGIYSRERLLIPISNPELLVGSTCFIELDENAKREVAVLYMEGGPEGKVSYSSRVITERGRRKVLESLKRSMQVDDGTAEYYLSVSNGDPRGAIMQLTEDLRWELQVRAT